MTNLIPAPSPRTASPHLRVVSFGYGHGSAPAADIVLDARDWFRDPHVSPVMRGMNGRDQAVVDSVLAAPGCRAYIETMAVPVALLVGFDLRTVTVAVGCVGGRHRSVVIADQLTARGRAQGWTVAVQHRDIDLPLLTTHRQASAADTAAGLG